MKYYYHLLAAILVGGCVLNPISSAIALLFILAAKIAEIYFTPKTHDVEKLEEIKIDVLKLKTKAEQESLGKAFARGNA